MFELMKCDEKGSAERKHKKSRNDETKSQGPTRVCVICGEIFSLLIKQFS